MSDPGLLVLASLADGDIQRLGGIRLGPGTLYVAIARLERLGWIRPVESQDRRQPHRLTVSGRRHLEEEVAALDQVIKTAARRLKHA